MSTAQYKAFISYSHADEQFASWLHRRLEQFRVPRSPDFASLPARPLKPIFRDADELASSSDLGDSLRGALAQSERLIVVCSPNSAASRWVNEEVREFLRQRSPSDVLCVLLDGEPNQVFPEALQSFEPLAADFRAGHASRRDALLRLVAGLLGVGFDALRQRDQVARHRRMAMVASGSLILTGLTSALAVTAYLGQKRAQEQAAVSNEIATFLTDLFLGADPGIARGSEITVREVLDAGAVALSSRVRTDPAIGAQLSTTMGGVYANLGDFRQAITLHTEALTVYEREFGPESVRYASALRQLGDLQYLRGEFDEASVHHERALQIHQMQLGDSHEEIAADLTSLALDRTVQGRTDEAEDLYRRALAMRLERLGPQHLDTAQSEVHLGWFLMSDLRFTEAERHLERALDTRKRYLGRDHFLVAETLDRLGNVRERLGKLEPARVLFQQAFDVKQKVLPPLHPEIAESWVNLASVHLSLGEAQVALDHVDRGLEIAEQITGPEHVDLIRALGVKDMALRELGDLEGAMGVLQRLLSINETAFGADHVRVAETLNSLGSLLSEVLGRHSEAEPHLERAIRIFAASEVAPQWLAVAHWTLANCRRDLGKFEAAAANYREAMGLLDYGSAMGLPGMPAYSELEGDFARLDALRQQPTR